MPNHATERNAPQERRFPNRLICAARKPTLGATHVQARPRWAPPRRDRLFLSTAASASPTSLGARARSTRPLPRRPCNPVQPLTADQFPPPRAQFPRGPRIVTLASPGFSPRRQSHRPARLSAGRIRHGSRAPAVQPHVIDGSPAVSTRCAGVWDRTARPVSPLASATIALGLRAEPRRDCPPHLRTNPPRNALQKPLTVPAPHLCLSDSLRLSLCPNHHVRRESDHHLHQN